MNNQVTVFGANGKVGSLVVVELLTRGHAVVAFVHNSHHLPKNANLKIVQGDIYAADDVDAAIAGSTAVVSCLGSWGTPKKDILSVGMTHIILSMQRHGVSRVVSLTGAEARAPGDVFSLIHRLAHLGLSVVAGKVLRDGEQHIQLLEQSSLDWTVIRSPIMSSGSSNDREYPILSMHRPLPWKTISRRLVVLAVVDIVADVAWRRKAPYIS